MNDLLENSNKQDTVWFSFLLTINLGNFNGMKINSGNSSKIKKIDAMVSSDVLPDETVEQAQERVEKATISYLEQRVKYLKNKAKELIQM